MDGQDTTWRKNIAENFNSLSRVHERYRRQTDGPSMTYSEREREFTFAKNVAVVNALQLEAALATPVLSCLITTPCQV